MKMMAPAASSRDGAVDVLVFGSCAGEQGTSTAPTTQQKRHWTLKSTDAAAVCRDPQIWPISVFVYEM